MKKILILGAGGQALNVIDILLNEQSDFVPFGIIDINTKKKKLLGISVIGKDNQLADLKKKHKIDYAFPAIGYGPNTDNSQRKKIFIKLKKLNFKIPNIISSKAILRSGVKLGYGNLIQPGAIVDTQVTIHNNISVGANCIVGHNSTISDHVTISGGAIIKGNMRIGEGTFLGMNCAINNDVGKWCKIGPCTTNLHKIKDRTILTVKNNFIFSY